MRVNDLVNHSVNSKVLWSLSYTTMLHTKGKKKSCCFHTHNFNNKQTKNMFKRVCLHIDLSENITFNNTLVSFCFTCSGNTNKLTIRKPWFQLLVLALRNSIILCKTPIILELTFTCFLFSPHFFITYRFWSTPSYTLSLIVSIYLSFCPAVSILEILRTWIHPTIFYSLMISGVRSSFEKTETIVKV